MAVNLTLLSKKSLISLRELEELIFPHSKRESDQVKQARRDFEALVIDALEAGRLGYLDWYFNDSPFNGGHYAKFEKRVVCAWIIQVDALEGIEVADEVVEFIEQAAKEKPEPGPIEEPQEEKILPAPTGTAWEDVTITLVAKDTVSITIGSRTERFSYAELGMSDKRTGDRAKAVWWFFVQLIKEQGFVSSQTENYNPKLPDLAKQFKVVMKSLFSIKDDILTHYKKEKGYRAKFKTIDKTHGTYQEIIRLPEA